MSEIIGEQLIFEPVDKRRRTTAIDYEYSVSRDEEIAEEIERFIRRNIVLFLNRVSLRSIIRRFAQRTRSVL